MSLPDKEQFEWKDIPETLRTLGFSGALVPLYYGVPPLIIFLAVGACTHRTGLWVLALAMGLLVEVTAGIIWAPSVAAAINSGMARAWFSDDATRGDALLLHEVPEEELSRCIPPCLGYQLESKYKLEYLNTRLGRRLEGLDPQFVPLRVFLVETRVLASIRSYGSLRSTSFIFLTEHPSSLVVMERFKFYHELAHTSYMGCIAFARRYSKTLSLLLAAVVIASMTRLSVGLAVVVGFFALRAWWAWTGASIECEMHADRSALGALGDPADAEEIVQVFRAVWEEDPVRLFVEYGQKAMRERNFRLWNMEAAIRDMKRAGGREPKVVPSPGRDKIHLILISYFAAGWAGWHSGDAPGLALFMMLAVLLPVWSGFLLCQRLLFASERELELAVKQRIQTPASVLPS